MKFEIIIPDLQSLGLTLIMPPEADYWKWFNVVGVVAYCLVPECELPPISLGVPPKPGEKKRICK